MKAEQYDEHPGEFPRVNDDYAGHATRYLYNSIARGWEFNFDFHGVIKYDNETGGRQKITYADSVVSGEHVFAPDPNGTAEDDGYLLTLVTDRATEKSELLVLDARDLEAGPVARVKIPHRVPIGFHANWFPEN